ncbi:uncharacterized protein LOC122651072 [Telopea speciosissima]|uniref:uncharacterized protein LOC122651072 n=1 Tax=Telopea speciosissima TaxID=54955 RepID=UPI001CC7C894|nr:uncharacterized protein LOC122651072 [Telopea speciosissima]
MLDGLLGRGFTSKCKSLIKLLKDRIDMIRRKRNAMQKFLKKDIADLLANDLGVNAYGRAEGLLVEMNLSSCYDLVEQSCDCILKQISVMQKQRECPEECREAVPSLIFAAARFADLPELRDLRQLFAEKYGNSLESFLNREFADKMAAKHHTREKKLQLMQDISKELSIKWDSKAFEEKLSNTPASKQGMTKDKHKPHGNRDDGLLRRDHQDFSSCQRQEVSDAGYKPKRDNLDGLFHGRLEHINDVRGQCNAGEDTVLENYNENISSHARVEVTPRSTRRQQVKTSVIDVPVADSNRNGPKNHSHLTNKVTEEKTESLKPFCNNIVPPPYVKPRGSKYGTNSETQGTSSDNNEGSSDPPYSNRDVMRNRSDRTKKRLDHIDNGSHMVGPARVNGHGDETDCNQDDLVGDAKSRPRSVRRHLKPPRGNDNIGNSQQEERRNLYTRKEDARRGPQTLFDDDYDSMDEEDKRMDELLLYYSKKKPSTNEPSNKRRGLKAPTNDTAADTGRSPGHRSRDKAQINTGLSNPLARAASLPPEPTTPTEEPTGPARANSFQPDGQAGHVHPKLPDYENLAARIAAFRTR